MYYLIQINYKSGLSVVCPFKEFSYKISGNNKEYNWKDVEPEKIKKDARITCIKALFLNVSEIESTWIVDTVE